MNLYFLPYTVEIRTFSMPRRYISLLHHMRALYTNLPTTIGTKISAFVNLLKWEFSGWKTFPPNYLNGKSLVCFYYSYVANLIDFKFLLPHILMDIVYSQLKIDIYIYVQVLKLYNLSSKIKFINCDCKMDAQFLQYIDSL